MLVGETATLDERVPTYDGESEVRMVFVHPGDDRRETVTVDSTPAPTLEPTATDG